MPELPEVETVRRTLSELVVGKTIQSVTVSLPRIIQKPDDIRQFEMDLAGHRILEMGRRGKFLRFIMDGVVLVSHLRMEGRYGLYHSSDPVEKHTHVIFHFTDGTELRYKDVRQFGTMHLFAAGDEFNHKPLSKLGLEPLDDSFTYEAFRDVMAKRTTKIKVALLNQEYVVGLGNIYVDEALFRAGIHPETPACELSDDLLHKLHTMILETLNEAVEAGGSSIKSYVNGQGEMGMFQQSLRIYGRKDESCVVCGHPVQKTVVGGRGTHYCPNCQPLKQTSIKRTKSKRSTASSNSKVDGEVRG
ncbi:DNA-formamidopyrimidine glycosylase [Paenibacillus motobuensis]|uniref:DNA-formamidopyrimidine glycosylase n=1 Tax=Paenibacillus TaxID=44249 RepID=UPI00203E2C25|nr:MULTISPECIES: DNA-formamidopyrimidine glycosylase [Paenibacillus]MCM3038619.1 DNA-formamidopyrimidine glycosylase [Paenibacillus lutimineralis]MCM3645723.1 DNA-formamidopyrimidine glycosylase [Paenibacillus motobuensis]